MTIYKQKLSVRIFIRKNLSIPINCFLTAVLLCLESSIYFAKAQIFLSPQNSSADRSSASINIDNTRCSSSGGSVPSLSLAVGADPYAINYFNDFDINNNNNNNNSPFLGIVSVNIPLQRTNQNFDCSKLHDLAVKRAKLKSLREMVDEQIISDEQYTKAVQNLYKDIIYGESTQNISDLIDTSINTKKLNESGAVSIPQ